MVAQCRGCGALVDYDLGSVWSKERGLCANCRANQSCRELVGTTKEGGQGLVKLAVAGTPLLLIILAFTGSIAWYWGLVGGFIVLAYGKAKAKANK